MGAPPRVDFAAECIWRDGERINLRPKAFQVLRRLMQQQNQLVTKRQLLDAVWQDSHVVEKVLSVAILQLRQALADDAKKARYIETVQRRGFRWIGAQRIGSDGVASVAADTEAKTCIGRDDVLAELDRTYRSAGATGRQLVLIGGDPGIGKTTLVDAFIGGLSRGASPFVVARGQCVDTYSAAEPYRPIFEAIESLWRGGDDVVRSALRQHAPSWLLQMPELAAELDLDELRRSAMVTTTERMQRELVHALEQIGSSSTIVMIIEDLHWSDPATIGLLWALTVRRNPTRLLLIGTYRPIDAIVHGNVVTRLRHELTGKRLCTEVMLEGLDSDGVAAYLEQRFVRHRLPPTFARRLQLQTSGNPLFLFNALENFERRGWLHQEEGEWQCRVDLDTLGAAIPAGTRDLIAYRIERLPATTQRILEAASAAGMEFTTQTVAAALDGSVEEVEAECERLARTWLILNDGENVSWPDGSRGRRHEFRHDLYRQVLYNRMAPTRRQSLHRQIAERLQQGHPHPSHQVAAQISSHFEQAGDLGRAVDWIETMLQHAAGRATPEVEALLGRAVALVKQMPESEEQQRRLLQLTVEQGIVMASLRGVSDSGPVRRIFEDARTLASSIATTPEHLASLGFTAATDILSGRLKAARRLGEQLLAFCNETTPRSIVVNAHTWTGLALLYMGELPLALTRLQSAHQALDEVAETAERRAPGVYDPTTTLRMALGLAYILSGQIERGWSSVMEGLAHARASGMPAYLGPALSQATGMAIIRRDLATARKLATELLELCEGSGLPFWMEATQVQLRWLDLIQQRDEHLIEPLRQAVESFHRTGGLGASRMYAMLADGYVIVGQLDSAAAVLDRAFDARGEEGFFDAELLRQRATILLARQADRARQHAEDVLIKASETANSQGTRLFKLRATVDLCRLWQTADRSDDARQRLKEVIAEVEEGTDQEEATTLLSALP